LAGKTAKVCGANKIHVHLASNMPATKAPMAAHDNVNLEKTTDMPDPAVAILPPNFSAPNFIAFCPAYLQVGALVYTKHDENISFIRYRMVI
jgi:hypothetical protein